MKKFIAALLVIALGATSASAGSKINSKTEFGSYVSYSVSCGSSLGNIVTIHVRKRDGKARRGEFGNWKYNSLSEAVAAEC